MQSLPELIRIVGRWRTLPGFAYGLRQSAVLGEIEVAPHAASVLAQVQARFDGVLEGRAAPQPGPADPAERIVELLAEAMAWAQRYARIAVADGFWLSAPVASGRASRFQVALPLAHPQATKLALDWALRVINGAQAAADATALQDEVHARLQPFAPKSLNHFNIYMAAFRGRIPAQSVAAGIVTLGTGERARWMESTLTDRTPASGVSIARMKPYTASVLRNAGLPGARHASVASADEAVTAAREIGFPVVVKPADLDGGKGVSADLRTPDAVRAAHAAAAALSRRIMVERFQPGRTHRLTVLHGRVIHVSRRIAGGVVGDGVHDIATLLQQAQQGEAQQRALRRLGRMLLTLDEEALGLLAQEGLSPASVPPAGAHVRLRRRDNINAGGTNEKLPLDAVHPANLRLACDAAALLRLDIAGIDFITEDIAASWLDIGGLICEVNAQPQLGARSEPHLYDLMLRELLGGQPRVPARLVITGDDEASRLQARDEALARGGAAVSEASGLWLAGERVTAAFPGGFAAAQALLRRTDVADASCIVTQGEILRMGLPLDGWDAIALRLPAPAAAAEQAARKTLHAMLRGHLLAEDS